MVHLFILPIFLFFVEGGVISTEFKSISTEPNAEHYLQQFGYIPESKSEFRSLRQHHNDTSKGLRLFQQTYHLPVTGNLDPPTLKLMNTPRCGNKDQPRIPGMPIAFTLGRGWDKTDITFRISKGSSLISEADINQACDAGFKAWADASKGVFTVRRVASNQPADIDIRFEQGNHGDGYNFDGLGGTVAHAWYPPDARMHLDDDENWDGSRSGARQNIKGICLHQAGHALGIGHSTDVTSAMYPFTPESNPREDLSPDDVAAVSVLYTTTPEPVTAGLLSPRGLMEKLPGTDTKPPVCYMDIEAAVRSDFMEKTLLFVDGVNVLLVDKIDGITDILQTGSLLTEIYYNPNAAFVRQDNGHYYFVFARRIYHYDVNLNFVGQINLEEDFPETPEAAFATDDGRVYIFGKTIVWNFDIQKKNVVPGSNLPIRTVFPGVPDDISGAMYDEHIVHFFKGLSYYSFDLKERRVTAGGPYSDTASRFMKGKCLDESK